MGAAPPPDPDADWRADLTAHRVLTIDDASTTEIDDGLSVELQPGGAPRLWVHIADPSRWVGFGDALDAEAARRSKSTYLPTGELVRCRCNACWTAKCCLDASLLWRASEWTACRVASTAQMQVHCGVLCSA